MMKVVHYGFDGLDIAFQVLTPEPLARRFEEAKAKAIDAKQDQLVTYRGVRMLVSESGGKGGYAYRASTGDLGAIWFFKKPNANDPWGIRVSTRALALAVNGLGAVRAELNAFLEAIGVTLREGDERIGRVDYAVDFLAPEFEVDPMSFVMHSHTRRVANGEAIPFRHEGTSGRYNAVTVGKMPGRQIIVYDKRREVIDRSKVAWWEIWNRNLENEGLPPLDPTGRETSQIWRVEIRAGKRHLKDRWGILGWPDLDDRLCDILTGALDDIVYAQPTDDSNRSRWPVHPIWTEVRRIIDGDLIEMKSGVSPDLVREVLRDEKCEQLGSQMRGLSATYATVRGIPPSEADQVPRLVAGDLSRAISENRAGYEKRMSEAAGRYVFLDAAPRDR